jgi:hypothetical protein
MKRLLSLKVKLTIAILFVFSTVAFGQSGNCAYTFTWTKQSFSFCVSQYGTLAMLQAPLGVNHLDPVNPVEGWVWGYWTRDTYFTHCQITGISCPALSNGSFSQPNGPGTLPLIFNSDYGETVTFGANPFTKSVSIQTQFYATWIAQTGAFLERDAVFQPGGNSVATFSTTGFGPYAVASYGDRLTSTNGCFGNSPNQPSQNGFQSCRTSSFTGSGTMYAVKDFSNRNGNVNIQVTYWVF